MVAQWFQKCKDFFEETVSLLRGSQKRVALVKLSVTADFMVDAIEQYWISIGYRESKDTLIINSDIGPEKGSRSHFQCPEAEPNASASRPQDKREVSASTRSACGKSSRWPIATANIPAALMASTPATESACPSRSLSESNRDTPFRFSLNSREKGMPNSLASIAQAW